MKRMKWAIVFLLMLLFIGGCGEREKSEETVESTKPTLQIGLLPEQNIFSQKKRYEPLAAYISRQAGVTVNLKILSRYGNIIDNFISGDLDGAFFGSFTGALAIRKLGVEPLARPEYNDGTSTYYGMIFTRKDSGIQSARDMKGKRFAFVDMVTTAGWLLPLHYFQEHGIDDYRSWFGETYFAGTHEDAIYDVLNGKADVGAAKNQVFYRLARKNPALTEELTILMTSPEVPANGLAVRHDLDETLKKRLKDVLIHMDLSEEGKRVLQSLGVQRFIETTVQDYQPVFDFANHIGLDLSTYDYLNQ
ncbi:MAG: phosphate/phosphite/phosphonate ABC transporter substrate-binding protein [Deltaproteobacteria bacterium]|nr:phosphate/phosphite/phosphonate ABC transporter substrate-binding protein [Candidatus Anaeroferrophillus wilburensis]MBN2887992.1 phosphate/phosphite/phosphonate ABC transporter substrate-binding protein [Deltaproteobacteria bacterium]